METAKEACKVCRNGCPWCGKHRFAHQKPLGSLTLSLGNGTFLSIPTDILVCENCGYLSFFTTKNLKKVGRGRKR